MYGDKIRINKEYVDINRLLLYVGQLEILKLSKI